MAQTPIKELTQKFHHAQILEKCKRLFFKRELSDVTSDEIGEYAGYSKRTIYIYFKSKEDIFKQVTLGAIDMLSSMMKEQQFANLSAFLFFLERFAEEHEQDFHYVMRKEFRRIDEADYFLFSEKMRPFLNLLAEKHNFILTNLDIPLLAWNTVRYGFLNELPISTIEKFVLSGMQG